MAVEGDTGGHKEKRMNVTIERRIVLEEAFASARNALLEGAGTEAIYFFRDKVLRCENLYPEEMNPVALYLLEKNLNFQRELRAHLLDRYGVDTLRLTEVLHLGTPDGIQAMVPPYVEISEERVKILPLPGDRESLPEQKLRIPLIIDGLHRAWIAKEASVPLSCIVCSGIFEEHRLYASYPVHWSNVKIYEKVPPVKKYYRRQDPYTFMRPLDALRLDNKGAGGEYGRK